VIGNDGHDAGEVLGVEGVDNVAEPHFLVEGHGWVIARVDFRGQRPGLGDSDGGLGGLLSEALFADFL